MHQTRSHQPSSLFFRVGFAFLTEWFMYIRLLYLVALNAQPKIAVTLYLRLPAFYFEGSFDSDFSVDSAWVESSFLTFSPPPLQRLFSASR
jgi:hypothetical protein